MRRGEYPVLSWVVCCMNPETGEQLKFIVYAKTRKTARHNGERWMPDGGVIEWVKKNLFEYTNEDWVTLLRFPYHSNQRRVKW